MRNLLIGIFLAGVAASPALAQDNGDGRWHHDQQQGGRGEGHQQRQQRAQQAQPQQPQVQQQARGPRFDGGGYHQQQAPQFVRDQQQVGVQQSQAGNGRRRNFDGRPNVAPQGEFQQQAYGYRGPVQVERNRNGGWTRTEGFRGNGTDQQQVRSGGWYGQRGNVAQQYRGSRSYAGNSWNRDWRNDRRYDWRRYRDDHRSVFHLGLYIDPFGYGYQPYGIGYQLPPVYFGQQYWIDPSMYELPYPPPGTQWVRYWNDALLVDMYSGQVVDVIQGFFW
ncbi:MAG TPA: RcnB family protein [Sphingomicrobium sp.]|nr:RcnB family protein [Sphingomicrobium sp.]